MNLKLYVSEQVKVFSIELQVLQQLGVWHEVGIVSRHGEITVTHHLLGGVGDQ